MLNVIVVTGLPGVGKSLIAEGISRRLALPIFSVDPIEAALWRSGVHHDATGIAAYEVAAALADEHLRLGQSIVIDAVSPVEQARQMWRNTASRNSAQISIIEVVCSDEVLHKKRIEKRVRTIAGMSEITWERVQERKHEYAPWQDYRLTLDSIEPPDMLIERAITFVQPVN